MKYKPRKKPARGSERREKPPRKERDVARRGVIDMLPLGDQVTEEILLDVLAEEESGVEPVVLGDIGGEENDEEVEEESGDEEASVDAE